MACKHVIKSDKRWAACRTCKEWQCHNPNRVGSVPPDPAGFHTKLNPADPSFVLVRSGFCNAKKCTQYEDDDTDTAAE